MKYIILFLICMLASCASPNKVVEHPAPVAAKESKKEMNDGVVFLLFMGAGSLAIAGLGMTYEKDVDKVGPLIYAGTGAVFFGSAGILYLAQD